MRGRACARLSLSGHVCLDFLGRSVCVINIQCLSACLEVLAEVGEIDSSSLGDCGWKTTTCLLGPPALDS